jgi:hypothetical protein
MKLLDSQFNEPSLAKFGEEACRLLIGRDFRRLADTFGYALAGHWEPAAAIEAEFDHSFSGRSCQDARINSVTVKYFRPNDTGLVAVIECIVAVGDHGRVLVELIVANNGQDRTLYLEEVHAVA